MVWKINYFAAFRKQTFQDIIANFNHRTITKACNGMKKFRLVKVYLRDRKLSAKIVFRFVSRWLCKSQDKLEAVN